MSNETLTEPTTHRALEGLFHAGLLPRRALEQAEAAIGRGRRWRYWSERILLCLGAALVLAGIVFFVAHHWLDMGRVARLGGTQLLILATAVAAWKRGLQRLDGQVLLFAASFLVGVFLLAFGQTYRSDTDAWELFRAWALLILGWVLVSRSAAHWLFWLLLVNAAAGLYWQELHGYVWERQFVVSLQIAVTQVLALTGFEWARARGYFRNSPSWPRWVLMPAALFCLAVPATHTIFADRYDEVLAWVLLALLAATMGLGYGYHRRITRDLFALTCIGCCASWLLFALVSRVLIDLGDSFAVFLLLGFLVIGMLGGLIRWVRRLHETMRNEMEGSSEQL